MKHSFVKLTSFMLLIIFVGILGLGLTADASLHHGMYHGFDCFSAGCGPVEHMVMHSYIVSSTPQGLGVIFEAQALFLTDKMSLQNPELSVESPPPKISLV